MIAGLLVGWLGFCVWLLFGYLQLVCFGGFFQLFCICCVGDCVDFSSLLFLCLDCGFLIVGYFNLLIDFVIWLVLR